jgi:hypothetical protein
MAEALVEMDHLFTSDRVLLHPTLKEDGTTYLLPPVHEAMAPLHVRLPTFVEKFDISIAVTSLYPSVAEGVTGGAPVISRHELFRALDKSPLSFGLFGPDEPLASRYPRSFRGYLKPDDFELLAARSTLCLSHHPHSAKGYLNERTCMILATGKPLVVDSSEGPAGAFVHGETAFLLDPKATPAAWVKAIEEWASPACKELRTKVGMAGKEWVSANAVWPLWWSTLEPRIKPAVDRALVLKPYCGLCNQITSILQGISLAKSTGRRLWIQGFQPSFNVYAEACRMPIEKFFDLVALSSAFEWPVQPIPPWVATEGLDGDWPNPQRASHAKLFKRQGGLLKHCERHKDDPIVYGGFLFFEMDIEKERKSFLEVLPTLVTPKVVKTYRWVLEELGLEEGSYGVVHLRIESDMVNHLARRSSSKRERVMEILQEIYSKVLAEAEGQEGAGVRDRTFVCVGTALDAEMNGFLEEVIRGMNGVTSVNQKPGIAMRLGKGREIAALIDFLLACNGKWFVGCDVSSFSELLALCYPQGKSFIFPRKDLLSLLV